MDGQTEYVASFPGVHFREWGRVTLVMIGKSVACVFVPGGSLLYGNHDEDPDHPGKCFCQSFLCAPRVKYTLNIHWGLGRVLGVQKACARPSKGLLDTVPHPSSFFGN